MRKISVALALVLTAVAADAGTAQISVSPYVGAMIYDGSLRITESSSHQPAIDNDPPVPVVGVRLGYQASARWGVEVAYGRSWLENERGELASHLYHVVVQYAFLRSGGWTAHLAGGGGGITYRPEAGDLTALSDPAVAGGAGLAYQLARNVAIRTDLLFMGQFCGQPDGSTGLACNDGSQLGYSQLAAGLRIDL